jgi:hypothetical protein
MTIYLFADSPVDLQDTTQMLYDFATYFRSSRRRDSTEAMQLVVPVMSGLDQRESFVLFVDEIFRQCHLVVFVASAVLIDLPSMTEWNSEMESLYKSHSSLC